MSGHQFTSYHPCSQKSDSLFQAVIKLYQYHPLSFLSLCSSFWNQFPLLLFLLPYPFLLPLCGNCFPFPTKALSSFPLLQLLFFDFTAFTAFTAFTTGITLKSGKAFGCSVTDRVRKFYRCANAILRIDGHSNEMVMLQLLETHCVPILTYAIEVVKVHNRDERRQLRVAYNSIFRKLFEYRRYESVRRLQSFLNKPTWEELIERRRYTFVNRIRASAISSLSLACLN